MPFALTHSYLVKKYLVFTATLAAGLLWFILTKLWFISFDFLLWNISLRTACLIALVAFILSVLIPGVVATQLFVLSGILLLAQASIIAFLEGLLFYEPGGTSVVFSLPLSRRLLTGLCPPPPQSFTIHGMPSFLQAASVFWQFSA